MSRIVKNIIGLSVAAFFGSIAYMNVMAFLPAKPAAKESDIANMKPEDRQRLYDEFERNYQEPYDPALE